MVEKTRRLLKRQDNVFIVADMQLRKDIELQKSDDSTKPTQGDVEDLPVNNSNIMRPASPTGWGFLKKLFRENKSTGMTKSMEVASNSPNIPRKLRRASLADHGISTKQITVKKERRPSFSQSMRKLSSGSNAFENALHFAVVEKDLSTINKLLDNLKVDVNFMKPPGLSPLHLACVAGHLKVIKLLIDHGANLTLKTWSGLTSLQIANMFGHFEVCQYLIEKGADYRDVQNGVSNHLLLSPILEN